MVKVYEAFSRNTPFSNSTNTAETLLLQMHLHSSIVRKIFINTNVKAKIAIEANPVEMCLLCVAAVIH